MIVAVNGNNNAQEINKAVDTMLARDSFALRSFLKEITPEVDTTFDFICPHCGYEQERMAMPITVQFFWPSL